MNEDNNNLIDATAALELLSGCGRCGRRLVSYMVVAGVITGDPIVHAEAVLVQVLDELTREPVAVYALCQECDEGRRM